MNNSSSRNGAEQRPDASERTPLLGRAQEPRDEENITQNGHVGESAMGVAPGVRPVPSDESGTAKQSDFMLVISKTRFWLIFGGVLLQYFVAMFDSTLMASAHPVITSYFKSSNAASWLSTAFMLTTTSFGPLFGRVSDTIGRKPLYLFALTLFIAATVWCALAPTMTSFVVARAVCGLAAGGMLNIGSIIANDLVRIEVRGTYQAYINLFYGFGGACGAAFGGFLCDRLGWRWAFGVQVPLVLVILVGAAFTVPKVLGPMLARNRDLPWRKVVREFDLPGLTLLGLSSAFLILGLNLGGNIMPWNHPLVITSLALVPVTASFLFWIERKAYRPVLPLAMLFTTPRGNLVFSNFFSQLATMSVLFNAPLYFQAVKLDSPSVSGFRLALPTFSGMIAGVGCGFFITWTGRMKAPHIAGVSICLAGAICLSSMWDDIPTWLSTIFVIPSQLGQAFTFPATTVAMLATSKQEEQAVVTTTLTLWRNLGIAMGVAISSLIVQNALNSYLQEFITGPNKAEIIERVRKSVAAIRDLSPKLQYEAMAAYTAALRVAFISAAVFYFIVLCLLLPIKLPNLRKDKVTANTKDDASDAEDEDGTHEGEMP